MGAVAALAVLPAAGSSQEFAAVGGGVVVPTGSLRERAEQGYTVRGRVGISLGFAHVQLLGGWSRLAGKDLLVDDIVEPGEDLDLFHAGVGVRVGLGAIWLGANAADFFGDGDEGIGFIPELGFVVGPFEVVADSRVHGPDTWAAVRAAIRF